MYVKPYYDARDGRLEQINVNKDIDALLLKNTQKDFESAVNIIEKKVDFVSPMTMFALSARAYDFGLRDEAVKWFYRGQNRLITALYVLDLVGQHVNPYAFCDLNKQHKAAQDAIDWAKNHPYQTVFLPQLPSKHPDRKQALKEAEAKLDARLVEQDHYFANPENKAKWEKERQDNLVNERFCW